MQHTGGGRQDTTDPPLDDATSPPHLRRCRLAASLCSLRRVAVSGAHPAAASVLARVCVAQCSSLRVSFVPRWMMGTDSSGTSSSAAQAETQSDRPAVLPACLLCVAPPCTAPRRTNGRNREDTVDATRRNAGTHRRSRNCGSTRRHRRIHHRRSRPDVVPAPPPLLPPRMHPRVPPCSSAALHSIDNLREAVRAGDVVVHCGVDHRPCVCVRR